MHYYAVKNLLAWMQEHRGANLAAMSDALAGERKKNWVNLGGQLIPAEDIEELKADIKSGTINTWDAVHQRCDQLWERYPLEKQRHAFATLLRLLGADALTPDLWNAALDEVVRIQQYVRDQVYATRKKDYDNPFRRTTFATPAETEAVMGTAEDNSFVKQIRQETEAFADLVKTVKARG